MPVGVAGEIHIGGVQVGRGYLNRPEETAATLTDDGWLRTGDVGRLDEDGYLLITDRLKDIIVTLNGKNVAGTATITGDAVELTGFSSDEGPDLHLYLAKGTTEADVKGGVRLGAIAYDKAAQRFTIPAGVSSAEYTHLVVHCDKALAVFGAAQLGR